MICDRSTFLLSPDQLRNNSSSACIYYLKSQSPIQQLTDLNGKTVAVIKSSTAEKCIGKLLPTAIAKVFKNYEAAKTALDYEQVNGILADDTILMGIMQQFPEQYRFVGDKLTQEPYAAAIVKGDRAFLQIINWDTAKGRFGNAPVWSEVLYNMLIFHTQMFPDKKIMILENGCVEAAEGIKRHEYISQHIHQVQRAVNNGVNIIGYICWCITSNREWGHPFDEDSDFGLYNIDLDKDPDLKRIPTQASEVYRGIVEKSSVI